MKKKLTKSAVKSLIRNVKHCEYRTEAIQKLANCFGISSATMRKYIDENGLLDLLPKGKCGKKRIIINITRLKKCVNEAVKMMRTNCKRRISEKVATLYNNQCNSESKISSCLAKQKIYEHNMVPSYINYDEIDASVNVPVYIAIDQILDDGLRSKIQKQCKLDETGMRYKAYNYKIGNTKLVATLSIDDVGIDLWRRLSYLSDRPQKAINIWA